MRADVAKANKRGRMPHETRSEGNTSGQTGVAFVVQTVIENNPCEQIELRRDGIGGWARENGLAVDDVGWVAGVLPKRLPANVRRQDAVPDAHTLACGSESGKIAPLRGV